MTSDYDPNDLVGTGRHLSKTELWAWTRFLDAARLLEELLAQHVSRDHDMTHSDYEVLVRLDGFGGSLRMTQLAEQVVSSSQKLTHTVNRLEKRGWVERRPVEGDGRGLIAHLLPPGRQALAEAAVEHAALIKRFLLDDMTVTEQQWLGDTMSELSIHMRRHRRGEPCADCEGEASEDSAPTSATD